MPKNSSLGILEFLRLKYQNIYRIVLKVSKNKKEIFMPSVVKITDLENEVQKLARNKKQIK